MQQTVGLKVLSDSSMPSRVDGSQREPDLSARGEQVRDQESEARLCSGDAQQTRALSWIVKVLQSWVRSLMTAEYSANGPAPGCRARAD